MKEKHFTFLPDTILKGPIKLEFELEKNVDFMEDKYYMGPIRFKRYEKGDSLILFIRKVQNNYSISENCSFDREVHYENGYLHFFLFNSARMYHNFGGIPKRWSNEGMERIEMGVRIKYTDFSRNLDNYLRGEPSAFFVPPEVDEPISNQPNGMYKSETWLIVAPIFFGIIFSLVLNNYLE